jgi:hypothetical protein
MRWASLVLIIAAVFPHTCAADDYLPLQMGNRWEYTSSEGDETREVTGTIQLWGEEVYVIEYPESVFNLGLENYWTTNPEGDVFLWGFWRDDDTWGMLYFPPIPMADAPLYLNKTWSHTFAVYELPDTNYIAENEIGFAVYSEGIISVPAGDFYAYGIGQFLPLGAGVLGDHSVTGERVFDEPRQEPTHWYSDGLGEVQYQATDLYQLVSFDQPVAVAQMSWGAVKALYAPARR